MKHHFEKEVREIESFLQNNVLPKEFSPNKWTKILDSKKCFESQLNSIKSSKIKHLAQLPLSRLQEYIKYLEENNLCF